MPQDEELADAVFRLSCSVPDCPTYVQDTYRLRADYDRTHVFQYMELLAERGGWVFDRFPDKTYNVCPRHQPRMVPDSRAEDSDNQPPPPTPEVL